MNVAINVGAGGLILKFLIAAFHALALIRSESTKCFDLLFFKDVSSALPYTGETVQTRFR